MTNEFTDLKKKRSQYATKVKECNEHTMIK